MKAKVASRGGDCRLSVKKRKAEKDPNKPKHPPSAFFVFMEWFRREFKDQNPENNKVSVVGKAGGEKWKALTEEEKGPYAPRPRSSRLSTPRRSTRTTTRRQRRPAIPTSPSQRSTTRRAARTISWVDPAAAVVRALLFLMGSDLFFVVAGQPWKAG